MDTKSDFRATPPAVTDIINVALPPLRTYRLPNGITMHVYDRSNADVSYLSIVMPRGQAEAGSPAVSALSSILQREGSASLSGTGISEILDSNGAWLNSSPSSHHTRHSLYTLNSRLEKVLPTFTDMVFHPTYPEDAVRLRGEALARNIEVCQNDTSYLAACVSDRQIMGVRHPLASVDTPDSIRAITPAQLAGFQATQCDCPRTHIYLTGRITSRIERLVADTFGSITDTSPAAPLNITPFSPASPGSMEIARLDSAMQDSVSLTLPAPDRTHPEYIPLHLTVMALGGYFGSRLMTGIREEKGLTYGIRASLLGYADGAHVSITADTDCRSTRQLIDEVRTELTRMSAEPPRGDELTRLRRAATAMMANRFDSPLSITDYNISALTSAIPDGYFAEKLRLISVLTPDMIADTAATYLRPELLRTAIAGHPADM